MKKISEIKGTLNKSKRDRPNSISNKFKEQKMKLNLRMIRLEILKDSSREIKLLKKKVKISNASTMTYKNN